MKARPVIQAGIERPERKKSVLVLIDRRRATPMPKTNAKVDRHDGPVDCRKIHPPLLIN